MGLRATLNFRKAKATLDLMYRIFLNFARSCILSFLPKFKIRKKLTMPFLKYKYLKLKLRVFLAGHTVAMGTYSAIKAITTNDWTVF